MFLVITGCCCCSLFHLLDLHKDLHQASSHLKTCLVVSPTFFLSVSLSFHSNSHFPGGTWLADTRIYPFWILLELRMTEVVVTAGVIRRAMLQSNRHY